MTLTAGTISQVSVGATTANLIATAATGGTGPYTYQWYRSTTSDFTPGGGNILSGKTALTLADTGLLPNTTYYYKMVATDTGNSNVTVEYTQLAVITTPVAQNQNAFGQVATTGMIDMRYPYATVAATIDLSYAGTQLPPGTAMKLVDSETGGNQIFIVTPVTALTDDVIGFINYDMKTPYFVAGSMCELSMSGNVIYQIATATFARGAKLSVDLLTRGGVKLAATSGTNVCAWAFDKATAAGQQVRVMSMAPSFIYVA